MPMWMWMLGGVTIITVLMGWSLLKMASICDDAEARLIREELARREAIGRVVEDVRRREHGL